MTHDEWQAECLFALVLAAETYDSTKGKFSTHAGWQVRYVQKERAREFQYKRKERPLEKVQDFLGTRLDHAVGIRRQDAADQASHLIRCLPPAMADIMRRRMTGLTQQAIADQIGMTKQRVDQLEKESVRRMYRHARMNGIKSAV